MVFLLLFALVMFFAPDFFGWFLESANFSPADPLKTPEHIVPVWYFTPYYAILRAIPDKLTGVIAMFVAVLVFFFLPWLDRHPVKSIRYRSVLFKLALILFAATFLILGYLGTQPPTPGKSELGMRFSELYFLFFITLWIYSKDRAAGYYGRWVVLLLVLMLIGDWMRFDATKAGLMAASALLPIGYLLVFYLGPVFRPVLNESKPVPERVT
jgi:ubiquinol-cytochrome c reductase cytochrome b subunit